MLKRFIFLVLFFILALTPSAGSTGPSFVIYGEAAWYSSQSCRREGTSGVLTASGERFREKGLTCALRRRDFGKLNRVTNLENGRSVVVRHNDFGPARRWRDPRSGVTHDLTRRVIDLSRGAFQKIASPRQGVIRRVKVERIRS